MAKLDVFDIKNTKVGEIELDDAVFNDDVREYLIHEAVKIQLANRRQGTVAVKNRAAVRGGGKKPFKQKGTGQARQGCLQGSPVSGRRRRLRTAAEDLQPRHEQEGEEGGSEKRALHALQEGRNHRAQLLRASCK